MPYGRGHKSTCLCFYINQIEDTLRGHEICLKYRPILSKRQLVLHRDVALQLKGCKDQGDQSCSPLSCKDKQYHIRKSLFRNDSSLLSKGCSSTQSTLTNFTSYNAKGIQSYDHDFIIQILIENSFPILFSLKNHIFIIV